MANQNKSGQLGSQQPKTNAKKVMFNMHREVMKSIEILINLEKYRVTMTIRTLKRIVAKKTDLYEKRGLEEKTLQNTNSEENTNL